MTSNKKTGAPCVVYLVWGDKYAAEVPEAIERSPGIAKYRKVVITDRHTVVPDDLDLEVTRVDFALEGYARKAELWKFLPKGHPSYLFLDSDTWVLDDISYAFEKAEQFGLAMVQANEYLLDQFKRFSGVLREEGVAPRGLAQFNTGVIFFAKTKQTLAVLRTWETLCEKYFQRPDHVRMTDQPFFSLALEKNGVSPHTLVRNYNFRPNRDALIGEVRIWHKSFPPPTNVNVDVKNWRRYDFRLKRMILLNDRHLRTKLSEMLMRVRRRANNHLATSR
jgi:hypothetical protein